MKFKDETAPGGSTRPEGAPFLGPADSGSLAPTAFGSPGQIGAAGVERARRGRVVIGWFTAGVVVGLAGAVGSVHWLIHTHRWPGVSSAASVATAPNSAPAASPPPRDPPPPSALDCPPPPPPEACTPAATAVSAAGAPAKWPGHGKDHKHKKPHVAAAAARAANAGAQPAQTAAESGATPAFVQAARAMVDHAAESELTDSLK